MITENAKVISVDKLQGNTYLIKLESPQIAEICSPGQFCNVQITNLTAPLLRRPFSICDSEDDFIWFMFEVCGEGTKLLTYFKEGDYINILGPLGNGFDTEGDYDTAVIVAGGIGVAPFAFLTAMIPDEKNIITFLGGRNSDHIITYGLENIYIATDDGSQGLKGNVIELMKKNEKLFEGQKIRIFSCGPNPMLKALKEYSLSNNYDCQLSTEGAMACGFGICQGCAIESSENKDKYKLICADGPVFNAGEIEL